MEKSVIYDYKTIRAKKDHEAMVVDAYHNLGWELISSSLAEGNIFYVNLSFKRNRKVANKMELLKIGEQVDVSLRNLEILDRTKKGAGVVSGISLGVAGALTFGGGLAMCLELSSSVGFIVGGVALGVAGIGIALVGWWASSIVKKRKLAKIQPIMESEYDKLGDLCEQAVKLLSDGDNNKD